MALLCRTRTAALHLGTSVRHGTPVAHTRRGNLGLIAVYPGVLSASELTCLNNYYSWRFPQSACPVPYAPPAPPPPVCCSPEAHLPSALRFVGCKVLLLTRTHARHSPERSLPPWASPPPASTRRSRTLSTASSTRLKATTSRLTPRARYALASACELWVMTTSSSGLIVCVARMCRYQQRTVNRRPPTPGQLKCNCVVTRQGVTRVLV